MALFKINTNVLKQLKNLNIRVNTKFVSSVSECDEYSATPNYPPILSFKEKDVEERNIAEKHEKIRKLDTVEEKLLSLNLPRYYGWDSLILREGDLPYNFLPFVQYVTRTQFVKANKLPVCDNLPDSNHYSSLLEKIRPQVQDALVFELLDRGRRHNIHRKEDPLLEHEIADVIGKSISEQINRILLANLSADNQYLLEAEVDYEPRLEAFWQVGGFPPDQEKFKSRKKEKEWKGREDEPINHWVQYFGKPSIQLRCREPLSSLEPSAFVCSAKEEDSDTAIEMPIPVEGIPVEEVLIPHEEKEPQMRDYPVPEDVYDPVVQYGLEFKPRHGTSIPGFWPGDPCEFGLVSYHHCGHLLHRPAHFGVDEHQEAIFAQATLAGYAWLLGQASYQGFSTFHDPTYPLVSQLIVTDGRLFSFFSYQLNTTLVWGSHAQTNPCVNVCYGTQPHQLYSEIRPNGDIVGWNDDVLAALVSVYLNKPSAHVDLRPYLHPTSRFLSGIEEDKRRIWLHDTFRHMYSNRPRHLLQYEIYDWEWIYKIKFQTRPMEARKRPFELWQDPGLKPYTEHYGKYIRKKHRNPDPRKKKKFEDTYYPDVL